MRLMRAQIGRIAVSAAIVLLPTKAFAVSLANLFQGATITADDKIFRDWTLLDQQAVNGVVDPTKIDVTPLVDDPLNPGVKFTGAIDALGTLFGHPGGASALLRFSFAVQTTNGLPLIKDNSLLINGWVFDSSASASITISETVRDASGATLGTKQVVARPGDQPDSGNPNHFDSATFSPHSIVIVEKLIEIRGPNTNDGARLTMFEQRFSQVPEPGTLVLASALVACGLASRVWRRRWR